MAKNLKDIVDEGFSKLSELAAKRKDVLARTEEMESQNKARGREFEKKLDEAENKYVSEINSQVEQLIVDLRQALVQVEQNNLLFQSSSKKDLRLRVDAVLKNSGTGRELLLSRAQNKLESLFSSQEKKLQSEKLKLTSESTQLTSRLDSLCRSWLSELSQAQSEIAKKTSLKKEQQKLALEESFSSIVKNADGRMEKSKRTIERTVQEQDGKLKSAEEKLESEVSGAVSKALSELKEKFREEEKNLELKKKEEYKSSTEELLTISKEVLSELESSCNYSAQELGKKLEELRQHSKSLTEQQSTSMKELDEGMRSRASIICSELKTFSAGSGNSIEDAFISLSADLDDLNADIERKLNEMLKEHIESVDKMKSTAEKSFSDLFQDFKFQLEESIRSQDQRCKQKEDDMYAHLEKLEKQIKQTYSQLEKADTAIED